jgi:hypothetical protein
MIVIIAVIVNDAHIHPEVVRQVILKYLFAFNFYPLLFVYSASGTVGRNKPLHRSACRPKWKSDIPITENQLSRKREEIFQVLHVAIT